MSVLKQKCSCCGEPMRVDGPACPRCGRDEDHLLSGAADDDTWMELECQECGTTFTQGVDPGSVRSLESSAQVVH